MVPKNRKQSGEQYAQTLCVDNTPLTHKTDLNKTASSNG